MPAVYLDSSALVKLILVEAESLPLRQFLAVRQERVSSRLGLVEVRRAAMRSSVMVRRTEADAVLSHIVLMALDDVILERAGSLQPTALRALDAIHLASALSFGVLEGMVVYDRRLAAAAAAHGLRTFSPGQA